MAVWRALRQVPAEAGHALAARILVDAEAERLLPRRIDGQHIAVGHGEEAEAGIGDLDALHQIGQLLQGDVGGDHAGDIGAILGPERVEEARDQIAGRRIDIGLGRGDVARHRLRSRRLQPGLPSLDHAGKEEVPEIRLVMAGIELVEGLGLIGIGGGAQDRRALGADVIHLQLAGARRHQADAEEIEDRGVVDLLLDLGQRLVVGPEEIAPDAEDRGRALLVLRPIARAVVLQGVAEIGIVGDGLADRRHRLRPVDQGLHRAGERGDLREDPLQHRLGAKRRGVDVVAQIFLVGVGQALLDLARGVAGEAVDGPERDHHADGQREEHRQPTTSMNLVRKLRGRNPRKGRERRPLSGRSGSTVWTFTGASVPRPPRWASRHSPWD